MKGDEVITQTEITTAVVLLLLLLGLGVYLGSQPGRTVKVTVPATTKTMYRITLLKSSVYQGYEDWGGPDQYVQLFHNGEKIIETSVAQDTFYKEWSRWYSKEIIFTRTKYGSDYIKVYLWDEDPGEDDLIGSWRVNDPMQIRKLSTDGSWIEFKVEKLRE